MSDAKPTGSTDPAIRWLEPAQVRASWEPDAARLRLRIDGEEEIADARVALAFPVSHPRMYLDLCDAKNKSIGMLESMDRLEQSSREAVESALRVRYLIPRILRIVELDETAAFVLRWRVETDRGARLFHTESPREAVKYQGPDRIRVTDLAGNHYDVPSLKELDAASRAQLEAYL